MASCCMPGRSSMALFTRTAKLDPARHYSTLNISISETVQDRHSFNSILIGTYTRLGWPWDWLSNFQRHVASRGLSVTVKFLVLQLSWRCYDIRVIRVYQKQLTVILNVTIRYKWTLFLAINLTIFSAPKDREYNTQSCYIHGTWGDEKCFCCFICVTLLWALHTVIKRQVFGIYICSFFSIKSAL